jgi:hypothetical protein
MNLEEIYWHLAEQASLCGQFRRFQIERPDVWLETSQEPTASESQIDDWLSEIGSEITRSLKRVLTEIALTEGQARHIDRVQRVLADGSRRTLNILTNAVAAVSVMHQPSSDPQRDQPASQRHRTAKA